jgi:spore germination protein KA
MKAKAKFLDIRKRLGYCPDLKYREISIGKKNAIIFFLESTSSGETVSRFIIDDINDKINTNIFQNFFKTIQDKIANSSLKTETDIDEIPFYLSSGFTIIFIDDEDKYILLETKADLDRGINTSDSEPILRGPKDSFTENYSKNIGLIRKRIKDENLWFKELKIGRRTKSKIAITYIKDIADEKKVNEIKKKLEKIDIDGILESGNLRSYLINKKSAFPQMQSTERPDIVCQALLEGKIVILTENTPFCLIIPTVFVDFLHNSEDYYQKSLNVSITRIIKIMAFFITIFTPAVYIGIVTFNYIVVPDELLISLAIQREGVPFPTAFEIILLMTIFEILRESDIRIPTNSGTTMSIVGALVLGQAAVDAGIVSPIAVIVVAITSICSLIFTDIDFINGIRVWRLIFILSASFLGLIGVLIAAIVLLTKLCDLNAYNTSFLSPFAPLNTNDQKNALILFPEKKRIKRPSYLTNKNRRRQS